MTTAQTLGVTEPNRLRADASARQERRPCCICGPVYPTALRHARKRLCIERRDGRLEVRLKTAGWNELVRWILAWQPDVKVLAPLALRRRVVEKMQAGIAAK